MGDIRQLGHCTQHAELTDGCGWCGTAEADLARASGQSTAAVAIHHLRGAVREVERLRAWADKYGTRALRRSDIDTLLSDSRMLVPPPAGGGNPVG